MMIMIKTFDGSSTIAKDKTYNIRAVCINNTDKNTYQQEAK